MHTQHLLSQYFSAPLIVLTLLISCSSKKDFTTEDHGKPAKQAGKTTAWDYSQIRKNRKEEAKIPPAPETLQAHIKQENERSCHPLHRSQVERARIEGCKRLDPKEGFGEDMYCCPKL